MRQEINQLKTAFLEGFFATKVNPRYVAIFVVVEVCLIAALYIYFKM